MKKQCKSLTKKSTRCSRNVWFLGYCKQHFFLSGKRIYYWLFGVPLIIGFFAQYAGLYQDLIKPVLNNFREPIYKVCPQDGKVRGIIRGVPKLENRKVFPINLGIRKSKIKLHYYIGKGENFQCFNPYGTMFKNVCPFSFKIDQEGYVFINIDLYDFDGKIIGRVRDNEFVLNINCEFSWNMDDKGFEIVNQNYDVVFSLNFSDDKEIYMQGVFYDLNQYVLISSNYIIFNDDRDYIIEAQKELPKMFKYTGKEYFETRK